MEGWLDKAAVYAAVKKVDDSVMLGLRLAPDQFPLSKQVQIACDTAKFGAARVTGKAAPAAPDTEATIGELKARIRATQAYLDTLVPTDFEGADTRAVTTPWWNGRTMAGEAYFKQDAIPNFYFHAAHVYALLRNIGLELGKADYLGELPFD